MYYMMMDHVPTYPTGRVERLSDDVCMYVIAHARDPFWV